MARWLCRESGSLDAQTPACCHLRKALAPELRRTSQILANVGFALFSVHPKGSGLCPSLTLSSANYKAPTVCTTSTPLPAGLAPRPVEAQSCSPTLLIKHWGPHSLGSCPVQVLCRKAPLTTSRLHPQLQLLVCCWKPPATLSSVPTPFCSSHLACCAGLRGGA